jgi:hypothetical protein
MRSFGLPVVTWTIDDAEHMAKSAEVGTHLGISNTPLQSYINRPHKPQFENLTLTQYFEWHDVSTGAQHCVSCQWNVRMVGIVRQALILIYHSALSTAD